MDTVMTVADLKRELDQYEDDAPVMIAVIKYPEEFALRHKPGDDGGDGEWSWTDSTDVELVALEEGEVTMQKNILMIAVELTDYDRQRHFAGG